MELRPGSRSPRPALETWKQRTSTVQEYLPDSPQGKVTPAAVLAVKLNVVPPGTKR